MGRDKQISINAERLYKKLFRIPEERKLLPIFLTLLTVMTLLEFSTILFALLVLITISVSTKLIKLKFNIKRTIFLTILTLLLGFVSFKLSSSFVGSFFLFLAVFHFCSEKGFIPSAIMSSIPFLLLEPFSVPFLVISMFLFFLYLRYLDFSSRQNLSESVKSFVKFWLAEDPRFLESFLVQRSELFEGRVRCLRIGNAKLISTDFHPGPFRNVGGSKLVEVLDSPDSVYLHSPSSHTRDPVAEEDVIVIKKAIECGEEKISAMRPFEIEGKNFRIFCFPFDRTKLIFVSGKYRIDDFIIQSPHFVVDCHNANFYGQLNTDELEEIRELVAIAEKIETDCVVLKSSFVKIDFNTESIVHYVAAILLDYGDERFAVVVFDSNNVKLEFRKKVEQEFFRLGYRAIVCSTDNHTKTGTRLRESYKPAGACREDYKALEKLVEKCKNLSLSEAETFYSERRVKVRVLGKILEEFEKVEKKANLYIAVFLLLISVNLMLPLAKVI